MKDFSNAFGAVELPKQQSANYTPRESNVDYDAFNAKQLEMLGGEGKHTFIGVITNIYDLGVQAQDQQVTPWDDKAKSSHAWRFEKNDKGEVKDPSASVVSRKYKGVMQECLVYTPTPVKSCAIAIDLPEVMFPYGDFFEGSKTAPYRVLVGKEGFLTKERRELAGTANIIAKPFKLNHVNVNRNKKDTPAHYALAANGKLVEVANWVGVTSEEGYFHAQDLGKLIGKAVMVDVEVKVEKWETGSRLKVDIEMSSKLGPRDIPYYEESLKDKLTDDLFGFVLFNADNDEATLKTINSAVVNTMKMSPEFEGSKLQVQLTQIAEERKAAYQAANGGSSASEPEPTQKVTNTQQPSKPVTQSYTHPEPDLDFEDDVPF